MRPGVEGATCAALGAPPERALGWSSHLPARTACGIRTTSAPTSSPRHSSARRRRLSPRGEPTSSGCGWSFHDLYWLPLGAGARLKGFDGTVVERSDGDQRRLAATWTVHKSPRRRSVATNGPQRQPATPNCHAGGRGFESRRSRTKSLQKGMVCCPARRGAAPRPHRRVLSTASNGQEIDRKPVRGWPRQAESGSATYTHEGARPPHAKAGGQAAYAWGPVGPLTAPT